MIRRIFRLYADGWTPRRIAAMLNSEGVPAPALRWRNRKGVAKNTWSHAAIAGDRRLGTGLLNQVKYIGKLIWNRSTWPRDPDRDGRQVRRNLPPDRWTNTEVPHMRIVPQDLWEAVKTRQAEVGHESSIPGTHKRNQRLLSGLLVCGKCGSRLVLRGKNTYGCASAHDRGPSVCDSSVRVNARAAEQALLSVVRSVLYNEDQLKAITERLQRRLSEARQRNAENQQAALELREQLAQTEREISNITAAIAEGLLNDDLRARAGEAVKRRERLQSELALIENQSPTPELSMLPMAVRQYVDRLHALLERGHVEQVKRGLTCLVTRIVVDEAPDLSNGKPGARLCFHGNLQGTVELIGKSVKIGNSPGGILTPLIFRLPPRRIRLLDRHSHGSGAEQRRVAAGGG